MELFQILAYEDLCTDDIFTVVSAVKYIFTLIQWAIPAVLIVLGTIDMFKAMTSGDEKEAAKARDKFIKQRLVYAVVAFLVPFIISLVFTFVSNVLSANDSATAGKSAFDSFMACWNKAK